MRTAYAVRCPRLPWPLFLAALWLVAGAAGNPAGGQPLPPRAADRQRFFDRLMVHDYGVLALPARPELAARLKLSDQQRQEIRKAVMSWVGAQMNSDWAEKYYNEERQDSTDDPHCRRHVSDLAEQAGRRRAEADRLRQDARRRIEALLTEDQKAAFDKLRPAPLKERWYVALPDYYGVTAFSPDGDWLAVGSGGRIRLYRMPTGEAVRELPVPAEGALAESTPQALTFSRDGKTLAAAWDQVWTTGKDGRPVTRGLDRLEVVRWDLGRRAVAARLTVPRPEGVVLQRGFAFSPDLRWLATPRFPGAVGIWDGVTGARVAVLKGYGPSEQAPTLPAERQPWEEAGFAFSPDGKTFAASFVWKRFLPDAALALEEARKRPPPNRIKLWDTGTWQERRTIAAFSEAEGPCLGGLGFTPDSALLGVGSPWVTLWEAATGRERLALPGSGAVSVHFPASGRDLVCVSCNGEVMVWDLERRLERAFHRPRPDDKSWTGGQGVGSAALSPDGRALALVAAKQSGTKLVVLSIPPAPLEEPR